MKPLTSGLSALALVAASAWPAAAQALDFSGTRSNITPGATPGGRCGPGVLTISFSPTSFAASGTSNLGNFAYTASHCIASAPPGPYSNGLFSWDFGDGVLNGSYTGLITGSGTPGLFNLTESISFNGGTGRFAGATGSASAVGTLLFGQFNGGPASYGEASFSGTLTLIPEPSTALLMSVGGLALAAIAWRRGRPAARAA